MIEAVDESDALVELRGWPRGGGVGTLVLRLATAAKEAARRPVKMANRRRGMVLLAVSCLFTRSRAGKRINR